MEPNNRGNGFRPINLNFNSNGSNNSNGGKNSTIGTIIFIVLVCIYVYNIMHNPEALNEYDSNEYATNDYNNYNTNNQQYTNDSEYTNNTMSWYDLIYRIRWKW